MDVDGSIIGFSLQVDIQDAFVSCESQNLCSVQGHNVVCNGFHRFQGKVIVINTKVTGKQPKVSMKVFSTKLKP
jgi:hypothetical protein